MGRSRIGIQNEITGEVSYLTLEDGSFLYAKGRGMRILTDIDLSNNTVDNVVIDEVSILPQTAKEGQITYYKDSFYIYNGNWNKCSVISETAIAGSKAFKIIMFGGAENKTYTLDSIKGLEVGDVFSLKLKQNFDNYGSIISINNENNTITVDNYVDDEENSDKLFRIPKKPEIGTVDFGVFAFAEGNNTIAAGKSSHAEGENNIAGGKYSHVEGKNNSANYSAHAEGMETQANGQHSHSEGHRTVADGLKSHAEGWNSKSEGLASHAENYSNATGDYSHSEGYNTLSSGTNAHSEGSNTKSTNDSTHAEGIKTLASGYASHAEGDSTIASGKDSHAEGGTTISKGAHSHAEGGATLAVGDNSHAEGRGTKAVSDYSSAHGMNTVAGLRAFQIIDSSISGGYKLNSVEGIEVGDMYYTDDPYLTGKVTRIGSPLGDNIVFVNTKYPSSKYNFIIPSKPELGNKSLSDGAFSEGLETKATGSYSHSEGVQTEASAYSAHVEGKECKATGSISHAEGYASEANGIGSHAENWSFANNEYTHAEGYGTKANSKYSHVQGKYNIVDSANKYAHIVGNGTADTERSNAHTVDWNGVGWFKGSLKIGGSSQEDIEAKTVATTNYVDSKISDSANMNFINLSVANTAFCGTTWTKIGSLASYCDNSSTILIGSNSEFPYRKYTLGEEYNLSTPGFSITVKIKILSNYDIMLYTSEQTEVSNTASCVIVVYKGNYIDLSIS